MGNAAVTRNKRGSLKALELGINLKGIRDFMDTNWGKVANAGPTKDAAFPADEAQRAALLKALADAGITNEFESPVLRVLSDDVIMGTEWGKLADSEPPSLREVVKRRVAFDRHPALRPVRCVLVSR